MTEKEKMLAGEVYSAIDPKLIDDLMATREVLYEYESMKDFDTIWRTQDETTEQKR